MIFTTFVQNDYVVRTKGIKTKICQIIYKIDSKSKSLTSKYNFGKFVFKKKKKNLNLYQIQKMWAEQFKRIEIVHQRTVIVNFNAY